MLACARLKGALYESRKYAASTKPRSSIAFAPPSQLAGLPAASGVPAETDVASQSHLLTLLILFVASLWAGAQNQLAGGGLRRDVAHTINRVR